MWSDELLRSVNPPPRLIRRGNRERLSDRKEKSRTRRSTKLSHSPFYRIFPANAVLTSRIFHQIARRSRGGRSVLAAWLEITLCSRGQKALTTSRFVWKVST